MIKFFRHIRQRMLKENRFSRYFLYAIGEIVLVVIGILIALSLNNWNADRKDGLQERQLLIEMHSNLEKDLADCRYNINFNQRLLHANEVVLEQLESRTPFHDSLRFHYGNIFGGATLTTNTSAYDNLKSLGFNLISNDSLRRAITQLYSDRYPYLERVETTFDHPIIMDQVLPQIVPNVVIDTAFKSAYPIDPTALMDNDSFKGMLRINKVTRQFMIGVYEGIEVQIVELIGLIEKETRSEP